MARALLMAGRGGQQKPKTKKRAAEDTLGDKYTEKRVKTNCWERSANEEIEAIRAEGRAQSIWFQRLMAASDRVGKDVEDYLNTMRTKEEDALRSSCWSRISRRYTVAAINLLRILHVWQRDQRGRKARRSFSSRKVLPTTG
jgi:hypothetical protein